MFSKRGAVFPENATQATRAQGEAETESDRPHYGQAQEIGLNSQIRTMDDDVEKRLRRIEAKLNGLSAVMAVVSITGLGALFYWLFKTLWNWNWGITMLVAWAIASGVVILAFTRGYRSQKS